MVTRAMHAALSRTRPTFGRTESVAVSTPAVWNCYPGITRWALLLCKRILLSGLGILLFTSLLVFSSLMVGSVFYNLSPRSDRAVFLPVPSNVSRYFVEKYAHHYEENNTQFFQNLKGMAQRKWEQNISNTQIFREDLRAAVGSGGDLNNFLLTRKNTKHLAKMNYYMNGPPVKLPSYLWKHLPKGSLYSRGRYKRCSIVGSSGVLNGSRCGYEIDKADYVIRFNMAPVRGFEADVGRKTNFTTLNPSFVRRRLNSLKTVEDRVSFDAIAKQFRGSKLWLPAFADYGNAIIIKQITDWAVRARIVQPILGHPDHFASMGALWRRTTNAGTGKWPSTGLYITLSFMEVCDRIDIFGFWPYPTSLDDGEVPYHYNNNVTATTVHSFISEFKNLMHWHERGIVMMHLGPCIS